MLPLPRFLLLPAIPIPRQGYFVIVKCTYGTCSGLLLADSQVTHPLTYWQTLWLTHCDTVADVTLALALALNRTRRTITFLPMGWTFMPDGYVLLITPVTVIVLPSSATCPLVLALQSQKAVRSISIFLKRLWPWLSLCHLICSVGPFLPLAGHLCMKSTTFGLGALG